MAMIIKLHDKVTIIRTKLPGEIVGFYQERLNEPMMYYILYWNKDGDKQEIWMRDDEFQKVF